MRGTWQTTGGSGGGSGGLVLVAVLVAAALIGSGAASAAVHALEVVLIVVGVVAVLAVAGGIAVLVWRARSDRRGRPVSARPVVQAPRERPAPLRGSQPRPAVEPPRSEVHLHLNVDPDQLAAIVRHYTEEN